MIDYNYLFDLTPISKDERLICSDYLEDKDKEILANCLRFDYNCVDYFNFERGYLRGRNVHIPCFNKIGYGYGKECGFSIEGLGKGHDSSCLEFDASNYNLGDCEDNMLDISRVFASRSREWYNFYINGCGYYQINVMVRILEASKS